MKLYLMPPTRSNRAVWVLEEAGELFARVLELAPERAEAGRNRDRERENLAGSPGKKRTP